MCGIAGFLNTAANSQRDVLEAIAGRMNDTLQHRGPDDAGIWADPEVGIALAHRRLSILDLSPEGHQPMISAAGRFVIVFNGEIYNYLPIRDELLSLGYTFRGHSDTEVMLAAFCEWGVSRSLERFNGMFSFALWDRMERTLYFSRDRLGKKPLYYGWQGNTLLFGSELKSLVAHPEFSAGINRDALALYARMGYIPGPYSAYTGISKLPPGTFLAIGPEAVRTRECPAPTAYWSARGAIERSRANPFRGSTEEAIQELNALLKDAVGIRMIADVPLGAFLSGGIDSSLVVALMHAQGQGPAKTFSIGFHDRKHNEADHAMAVARHLGSDHTELYVTPEQAMAVIPRLPTMYDEPFADSSQIPTFLVSQLARSKVTVSLSGDGGDELFGGYSTYFSTARFYERYRQWPLGVRQMMAAGASAAALVANGMGSRLRRRAQFLRFRTPEELAYKASSYWQDPSELLPRSSEAVVTATDPSRHLSGCSFIERMMYLDTVTYLPDDILVKVDRASMGVSLESRCPLLDYRVLEFAWRLPMSMKVVDGGGKWIVRELLYRYVPREIVDRPKQGFAVPVGDWIRGPLRDWAESLLNNHALRDTGLFDPAVVTAVWKRHIEGTDQEMEDVAGQLWVVLMAQAWMQSRNPVAADQCGRASMDS
jgi:asparagine synthase (glutamine-hydrolysing)